jgi:hypothetical protein
VPCNIDLLLKYATVEGLEICRYSFEKKAVSLRQLEEFTENSLLFCNRQEVCVLRSVLRPRPVSIDCYLLIVEQAEFFRKFSNKFQGNFLHIQLHTYFKIPVRSFNL